MTKDISNKVKKIVADHLGMEESKVVSAETQNGGHCGRIYRA